MKVVILGANGFIGKHLSSVLSKKPDVELILISRSFSEEFRELLKDKATFYERDLADTASLRDPLSGSEVVFDLIWTTVPSSSWTNPLLEITDNVLPTLKLLDLCCELGIGRFFFASSAGTIYGRTDGLCYESTPAEPFSPYGIAKSSVENYLRYYRIREGLSYTIFRISNPYGEGLDRAGFGVINTWLRAFSDGEPIVVFGDGSAAKDYIYVEDVAILMAGSLNYKNLADSYNLASGSTTSLNELIEIITKVTGKSVPVRYVPSPASDNSTVSLSTERLTDRFAGYQPRSLEEGIKALWRNLV